MVYGRWLIEGAPRILLIDTKTGYKWLDEWKADLWNTAGIPTPHGDDETNEAVVFGYLVAWFLGEVFEISLDLSPSLVLTGDSSFPMSDEKRSSHISMSGSRVSPFLSPKSEE